MTVTVHLVRRGMDELLGNESVLALPPGGAGDEDTEMRAIEGEPLENDVEQVEEQEVSRCRSVEPCVQFWWKIAFVL